MNTDPRTDDELNRIIAEWCGWTYGPKYESSFRDPLKQIQSGNIWKDPNGFEHRRVPNFCSDLNACHEAEDKMCDSGDIKDPDHPRYKLGRAIYAITPFDRQPFRATARQRAEALVKVIE